MMHLNVGNQLIMSGLCVLLLAGSARAVESGLAQKSVREQIQDESDKLTRLSAKLDVLEDDLKLRRPQVDKLKMELRLLEEQMKRIQTTIREYDARLDQFKKLNMDLLEIESNIKRLRDREKPVLLLDGSDAP